MNPSVTVWVSKPQQGFIYEWSVSLFLTHFPCPFLESIKEIKAVSGDLLVLVEQHLHLLPVLPAGSLPSHKLQLQEHLVSDDGMGRIWVDSPACDTRLLHTTPQQARGVWPDTPRSVKERRGSKTFCCSDLSTYTFFLREMSTKGKSFAENIFLPSLIAASLPVRVQHHSVSIFSEIAHEHKVRPRQVEVPSKISQH